jgi:hypothetical protein
MAMSAADQSIYLETESLPQLLGDVTFMLTLFLAGVFGWFVNDRVNRYKSRVALHQKLEEKISDDEGIAHLKGGKGLVAAGRKSATEAACKAVDASAEHLEGSLASSDELVDSMEIDGATEASDNVSGTEESISTVDRQDLEHSQDRETCFFFDDDGAANDTASIVIHEGVTVCAEHTPAEILSVPVDHAEEQPEILQDLKVLEVVMMAGVGAYVEESLKVMKIIGKAMAEDGGEENLDADDIATDGIHVAVCCAQKGEFRSARLQIISTCRSLLQITYRPDELKVYKSFFDRAETIDRFMQDMEEGCCSISFLPIVEADLSMPEDGQEADGMMLGASAFQPIVATATTSESSVDGPTAAVAGITKAAHLANSGEYRAAGMEIIQTNRLLQQIMRFPEHHAAYMLFIERAEKVETFINERMAESKSERDVREKVEQEAKEKAATEAKSRAQRLEAKFQQMIAR